MNKNGIFAQLKEFFADMAGKNRFERADFVLLKAALMLAAVDGDVSEDEVAHFKDFAAKCRGYSGESFGDLWENAMRSAGYLLLQSRFLSRDELVEAFVKESEGDFVGEAIQETSAERNRAFKFLERMAMADGEYSEIERACIAALMQRVKAERERILAERYSRAAYIVPNTLH